MWNKYCFLALLSCLVITFWLALFGGPWRYPLAVAMPLAVVLGVMEFGSIRKLRRNFEADRQAMLDISGKPPDEKTRSDAQVFDRNGETDSVDHPYPFDLFNEDNPRFL